MLFNKQIVLIIMKWQIQSWKNNDNLLRSFSQKGSDKGLFTFYLQERQQTQNQNQDCSCKGIENDQRTTIGQQKSNILHNYQNYQNNKQGGGQNALGPKKSKIADIKITKNQQDQSIAKRFLKAIVKSRNCLNDQLGQSIQKNTLNNKRNQQSKSEDQIRSIKKQRVLFKGPQLEYTKNIKKCIGNQKQAFKLPTIQLKSLDKYDKNEQKIVKKSTIGGIYKKKLQRNSPKRLFVRQDKKQQNVRLLQMLTSPSNERNRRSCKLSPLQNEKNEQKNKQKKKQRQICVRLSLNLQNQNEIIRSKAVDNQIQKFRGFLNNLLGKSEVLR